MASDSPVTIVLSRPPAPGAPVPTLNPPVPGQWSVNGATLSFVPTGRFEPWSKEEVTVPAGLADPETVSFSTSGVPVLRSQQLLAELGYLPVSFTLPSGQAGVEQRANQPPPRSARRRCPAPSRGVSPTSRRPCPLSGRPARTTS